MTAESMTDLNRLTLIGMVEERGAAWHRRDDLQGDEDNHYQRFIPVEDVKRRLFNWDPMTVPVGYLVPCDVDKADFIRSDGQPVRVVESQQGRVGVLREDNDYDMGVFMDGVVHPPYQDTLIREAEMLTGTELGITSAGLLAKGSRAWVEFSLPETLHDPKSGLGYRPNLVCATSMDGSLAHTKARTINATVCDNTLTWNLLEARASGALVKRKHTALSLDDLQEERQALAIINETAEEFERELHALIEREITKPQVIQVLDIIMPLPEDEGRAMTMAQNKRDQWMSVYTKDPMVAQWEGTAFGVFQTFNTIDHWYAHTRGETTRSERNTWRALNGKRAQADREVVKALELALA